MSKSIYLFLFLSASLLYPLNSQANNSNEEIRKLLLKLNSRKISDKQNAITQLAKLKEKAYPAIPVLIKILQDKNAILSGKAIKALGSIGPKAHPAIPFLKAAVIETLYKDGINFSLQKELIMQIAIDLPEGAFSALKTSPEGFIKEMKLTAAVKWYDMRLISQAKAAEIAGVSRAEFLDSLARFGVSPFQQTAEEIARELEDE